LGLKVVMRLAFVALARFGLTVCALANDSALGALATLAFLVVLRVLISDFFWIDIAELLLI
jgi:hypothetical protein